MLQSKEYMYGMEKTNCFSTYNIANAALVSVNCSMKVALERVYKVSKRLKIN